MKRARRILSVILSLSIVMALFVFPISTNAATAKAGSVCMGDSEVSIAIGSTDADNVASLEADVAGLCGKAADDVVYKITKGIGNAEGKCLVNPTVPFGIAKRAFVSFDFMLTSDAENFYVGYGAAKEGATDHNSFNNINKFINVSAQGGLAINSQFTVEGETPNKLSKNQWHNFALDIAGDGTTSATVYLDGVKYEGNISVASFGIRHLRISIGGNGGVIYLDNYYVQIFDASDKTDYYAEEEYLVEEISVENSEKVSYNSETKQFKIEDESLTAAELAAQISANEGYSVKIYENAKCETELSGSDLVTIGNVVVVSNGKAFSYYDFERTNDSIFTYEDNKDGITATITGFKEEHKPTGTTAFNIEIPEKIAGYTVTAIGTSAFQEVDVYSGEIIFPDTIKTIGDYAFHHSDGAYKKSARVTAWPAQLEIIGQGAFVHCVIAEKNLPASLRTIKDEAFQYASLSNGLVLNDGLEKLGANVVEWTGVREFIIPDSVISMGDHVLRTTANNLKKVRFPRNEKFTKIPNNTFSVRYPDRGDTYFSDLSLYIPETITIIPQNILNYIKTGTTLTIYGAMDTEAYNFYNTVKAGLADGTITNALKGSFTIKFIEYNFDDNYAYIIDENGVNTGDIAISPGTPDANTKIEAEFSGNGGKKADDVVLHMTTMGGDAGHNFLNFGSGSDGKYFAEFSAMIPSAGEIRAQVGYYLTHHKKDDPDGDGIKDGFYNKGAMPVRITPNAIYVYGKKVVDAISGRWYNFAVEVENDATNKTAVYINGVKYEAELEYPSYGVRHFRIYPNVADEMYSLYFDNLRNYTLATRNYNPKMDVSAEVTAKDTSVRVFADRISYTNEDAQFTVSELKAKLETDEKYDAALRIYEDATFAKLLQDSDIVPVEAVVVVAAKNGCENERSFAYLTVNPPVNTTIFDMTVINEAEKTAMVTGFLRENIVETDDLSAIAIPEEILGYKIVSIGASAFENESVIQSVSIPDTVERIEANAFAGNKIEGTSVTNGSITNVKLSKNLKYIGAGAFKCNPLEYIELPEGLETIESQAFYWTNLKEITIPNSVKRVSGGVFRLCNSLEYVKLSSSLKSIGSDCFYATGMNLRDIVIPESVESIADSVFYSYEMDTRVHGVPGSYAEQWANKHGFEFMAVKANTLVVGSGIYGDGEKELIGSDYDIDYDYKTLSYKGKFINLGSKDVEANIILALYDEKGYMIEKDIQEITIKGNETKEITLKDDITIPVDEIKDGYSAKMFIWRQLNNEPIADALVINFDKENREIHALAIANSFCNDSFAFINNIAKADGVTLKVQNMYIGGAKITQHYTNMLNDLANYTPVINMSYGEEKITMKSALESDKWSVVALQAATHGTTEDYAFLDYETWKDTGALYTGVEGITSKEIYEYIKDYVDTYAPGAKKIMHMSWGPCENQASSRYNGRFKNAENPRTAMFEAQKAAYEYASTIYADGYNMMVPSSYAVQYALNVLGYQEHSGEVASDGTYPNAVSGEISIYRDETCHLTSGAPGPYGRVLASLTWYEYLTGNDVTKNAYQHPQISAEIMAQLKEAAHWANEQVTPISGNAN